jgi:peptide deformylase
MNTDHIVKLWDTFAERLRTVCTRIEANDSYNTLLLDMAEFVLNPDNKALWLSLPQLGITKRWYVAKIANKVEIFINPKITLRWHKKPWQEACLSEPWVEKNVFRNEAITVKYTDVNWELKELKLVWLYARTVQHEQDHLNGILLIDK